MSSIYIYGAYGAQLIAAETGKSNDETGADQRKLIRPDLFKRDFFGVLWAIRSCLATKPAFQRRFGVRETNAGNRNPTVSVAFARFEFILNVESKNRFWLDVSYPTFLVTTKPPRRTGLSSAKVFMAKLCPTWTEQRRRPSC